MKAVSSFGAQSISSSMLASWTVYWYWVRDGRPPTLMSCEAWRNRATPSTGAVSARSRLMIWSAVALRSLRGFRLMKKRPVLVVCEPPVAPTAEVKLAMSGSLARIAASCCWRSTIAANEMSCAASDTPVMNPVSCCGKKPLGMTT